MIEATLPLVAADDALPGLAGPARQDPVTIARVEIFTYRYPLEDTGRHIVRHHAGSSCCPGPGRGCGRRVWLGRNLVQLSCLWGRTPRPPAGNRNRAAPAGPQLRQSCRRDHCNRSGPAGPGAANRRMGPVGTMHRGSRYRPMGYGGAPRLPAACRLPGRQAGGPHVSRPMPAGSTATAPKTWLRACGRKAIAPSR